MTYFNFQGIDYNTSNNINNNVINTFIDIINSIKSFCDIIEVIIEDNDYGQIFLNGNSKEWSDETLKALEIISKLGIETNLADEDYGEVDVINIYLE